MRLLFLIFILSGCGYNNTKIPSEPTTPQGAGKNEPAEVVLDFASVKAQVFQNYCLRCHSQAGGNKAGINLENYSSVKPNLQIILSSVESGFMPLTGTMPSSAKSLLAKWVQAGAPEFGTGSTGGNQNQAPSPSPSPAPIPCEEHHQKIEDGQIANLDEQFYFDFQLETLKRRNDDCEDSTSKNFEPKLNEGN